MTESTPIDAREPIHEHFGLSYAEYLVVNRTLLQSMPIEWQARFVDCLRELDNAFDVGVPDYRVLTGEWKLPYEVPAEALRKLGWKVKRRGTVTVYIDPEGEEHHGGRECVFLPGPDPIPHYWRGRTRLPLATEEGRGGS